MEPGRQNGVRGDAAVLACASKQTATTDRPAESRDTAPPGFGAILDSTPFVPAKSPISSRSSSPGASAGTFPMFSCAASRLPWERRPPVGHGAKGRSRALGWPRRRCRQVPLPHQTLLGPPGGGRPTGGRRSQAFSMVSTRLTGHHRFRPGSSNWWRLLGKHEIFSCSDHLVLTGSEPHKRTTTQE